MVILYSLHPHGSIHDHLFFLIYINDLPRIVNNNNMALFPDETNIIITDTNRSDFNINANQTFQDTNTWFKVNSLSWIERGQLNVTCFIISLFNAQHVSDVSTSILRSLRLICWVISWVVLLWFNVCVGVMLWFGWGGVVSVCRLKH